MGETVFDNAQIVLRDRVVTGSLVLRDGRIAAFSEGRGVTGEDIDGDFLLPGLIELHTDFLEGCYLPRPKVKWNPIAAVLSHDAQVAASGITTVFDALRVGDDADSENVGEDAMVLAGAIADALDADMTRADHLLHIRCELSADNAADEFERMADSPRIRLVSLMDHTPGQRQFTDLDQFRTYYGGKTGWSTEKLDAFIVDRQARGARVAPDNRRRIVERARSMGLALASHDDATAGHVAEAIADGVAIAEFPTREEAARASHGHGMKVLMGAPNVVRGGSHSGNIAAAELARLGLLDILSSDYIPYSLLQAAFDLPRHAPEMNLADAMRTVTVNPAEATGLADRGEIAEGLRADLVRVRLVDGLPVVRGVWREGRRVA
ncbi:MAG: phosphonate metabolism protein PhnM [Rhizobiales bacterium NRL2]|jgi:alpha-D-ribose 1-methylphosphonate 5-triphosphate diphosphatase|nr:MAG: phosphonate metabolism protein PhnM [Rhizobiales bacterium NRL2]